MSSGDRLTSKKPLKPYKLGLALSGLVLVGASGAALGVHEPDLPIDLAHAAFGFSPTEKQLSHAAKKALGVTMYYRCASAPLAPLADPSIKIVGQDYDTPLGNLPLARVEDSLCKATVNVRNLQAPVGAAALVDAGQGIMAVTHEAEHYAHDQRDETQVQCRTLQDIRTFALALGASGTVATEIDDMVRTNYVSWVGAEWLCPS